MADGRIKDLNREVTNFSNGDFIAVDGTIGTSKMAKDSLLELTASDFPSITSYITDNGSLYIDGGYGLYGNTIYFTFNQSIAIRGRYNGSALTETTSLDQLATALGVSKETSPGGIANCLSLAVNKYLVYNLDTSSYAVVDQSQIGKYSLILIANRGGMIVGGKLDVYRMQRVLRSKSSVQVYCLGNYPIYVEESKSSGGSIYIKYSNGLAVRGMRDATMSMSALAAACGVSVVTSPKGVTECIEIADSKSLCVTESAVFSLKSRYSVNADDIVLASCVNGRVVSGALDYYVMYSLGNLIPLSEKGRLSIYVSAPGLIRIDGGYNLNGNKVYFTYGEFLCVRGTIDNVSASKTSTISSLATELGVSLVTSPAGISNCIELSSGHSLVFSIADKNFHIRTTDSSVAAADIILLNNRSGELVFGELVATVDRDVSIEEKRTQLYGLSLAKIFIEESKTLGGSVYFNCSSLSLRGNIDRTLSIADIASELGVTLVTSPKGMTNCIEIESSKTFVVGTNGKFYLKNRTAVAKTDVVIIACVDGQIVNRPIDIDFSRKFDAIENKMLNGGIAAFNDFANSNFATSLNAVSGDVCTILFFSDPHCMGSDGLVTHTQQDFIDNLFKTITCFQKSNAVESIICGGDILNTGDTQVEAMRKLGYFIGNFKNVVDNSIMVIGNHDTNYLGKLDAESAANTGKFSIAQQNAALFQTEGRSYYVVHKSSTDIYVLDTGTDFDTAMDEYKWGQIDWLAQEILSGKNTHAVVAMHIYSTGGNDANWASNITPFASYLQDLLGAVNSRGAVTLNGVTYDFTNCEQTISAILCGHSHFDKIDSTDSVPVIAITNTNHNGTMALDAIVVDYTSSKMRCTRIGGYGSDREVDIIT